MEGNAAGERPTVTAFFAGLGERVRERWQAKNYDERAFPAVAARALAELPPSDHVNFAEVINSFLAGSEPFPQAPLIPFGQPPLVVYQHDRFFIELLFWLDGTTTIHQHAFSGAFQVVAGSSIHTEYTFEQTARVDGRMQLGRVGYTRSERLVPGDVREIRAGREFIHALFHLERPSVTAVVRTYDEPDAGPQWNYEPPCVAVDPGARGARAGRALQFLDLMAATSPEWHAQALREIAAGGEVSLAYAMLSHALVRNGASFEELEPAFEALAARAGRDVATQIAETIRENQRREYLTSLRDTSHDADVRFALAVLINVPSRDRIHRMVSDYAGVEAPEALHGWLRTLIESHTPTHATLLGCNLSCAVPVPGVDAAELLDLVLGPMLRGARGPELLAAVRALLPADVFARVSEAVALVETSLARGAARVLFG